MDIWHNGPDSGIPWYFKEAESKYEVEKNLSPPLFWVDVAQNPLIFCIFFFEFFLIYKKLSLLHIKRWSTERKKNIEKHTFFQFLIRNRFNRISLK